MVRLYTEPSCIEVLFALYAWHLLCWLRPLVYQSQYCLLWLVEPPWDFQAKVCHIIYYLQRRPGALLDSNLIYSLQKFSSPGGNSSFRRWTLQHHSSPELPSQAQYPNPPKFPKPELEALMQPHTILPLAMYPRLIMMISSLPESPVLVGCQNWPGAL